MRNRRSTKLVAVLAGVSLIAAACGGDDDDTDTTGGDGTTAETATEGTGGGETTPPDTGETTPPGTEGTGTTTGGTGSDGTAGPPGSGGALAYAEAQEFSDYNNNTLNGNSVKNGLVLNEVLPDTFYFAGPSGELVMDEELLESAELTSEDPQVVEYVVNPDAAWSDGEPIDCDDFQIAWMASNGKYVRQENGAPVTDPETGLELPVFDTAGTTGYDQIETVECSEDGKTITTTYSSPFADWQGSFTNMIPAHILEQEAGIDDIGALIESEDPAQLQAAGEFWNTGWTLEPGELKPDIMPSGDKMIIDSWEAGQSLTLVPNPEYWGTPATAESVTIRVIADDAQAQALQNGEVQVMDPQPNRDLLQQLEGAGGIVQEPYDSYTYEHFDFNFRNDALKQFEVRQAFAKCVPRQEMIDQLIAPLNPEAEVLNSRWLQYFEEGYEDTSGGEYAEVDIEGAQQLLEQAGVETPLQLRVGWLNDPAAPNQRRADQITLLKASCDQAGFEIIDSGTPTFFDVELPEGDYDIAMFAWSGSPLKTGSSSTFQTNGGNNLGNYRNEEVDGLIDELNGELNPDRVTELANEIDAILWEDLATIPLFTHPALTAYAENASGIVPNPSQNGVTWNASAWAVQ